MMRSSAIAIFVVLVASSLQLIQQTDASCNCYDRGYQTMRGRSGYGSGSYDPYRPYGSSYGEKCVCTRDYNYDYKTEAPTTTTTTAKSKLKEVIDLYVSLKDLGRKRFLENAIAMKKTMIDHYSKKLKELEGDKSEEDKYKSYDNNNSNDNRKYYPRHYYDSY